MFTSVKMAMKYAKKKKREHMAFILVVSMQKSNMEFALHTQVTRGVTYSCEGK